MASFIYYAVLTLVGFLVASLLVFNSLVLLIRAIAKRNVRVQTIGGLLSHMAMGIILVGLIGSSVYSYKTEGYLAQRIPETASGLHSMVNNNAPVTFYVKNYALTFVSEESEPLENGDEILYTITLDVSHNGVHVGQVKPQITEVLSAVQTTGKEQFLLHPSVLSMPTEDLFVVFGGVDRLTGYFWLDVRVTPLIWYVWVGFALLMLGTAIAAFGRRESKPRVGVQAAGGGKLDGALGCSGDESSDDESSGDVSSDDESDDDNALGDDDESDDNNALENEDESDGDDALGDDDELDDKNEKQGKK